MMADYAGLTSRKASKDVRRQQLIEATIDVMARKGYAGTTIADVAKAAGLSSGIVNFHFETKENLLVDTLKYLAEEYRANWRGALDGAGPDPAERLEALLSADFNPEICSPRKLAAWCAFWAEATSRPTYLEHCSSNDAEYSAIVLDLCTEIIAAGKYPHDPRHIARALDALLEGLWIDLMTMTVPYSLDEAKLTIHACLYAFFPGHYPRQRAIRPPA
ncbi:MAG: TetR family transcriptional regulator C-terminal domain-containing protein [Hyphomicrobiales bacterium]